MDVEAIAQASDNELLLMGLDKKGDMLSLRNFSQKLSRQSTTEERRAEKMALLNDVLGNSKAKKSHKNQKDGKGTAKTRKVLIGWLHFDDDKKCFVSVRANKGGGTREVDVSLSAREEHVINIAKDIFFSDGQSTFGSHQDMIFGLANFQHEDISKVKVSGVNLPFTLQRYIEKCKMSRVRLYLTSKVNTESDDIISCITPPDQSLGLSGKPEAKECSSYDDEIKFLTTSKLEERRKLVAEQDAAYKESLLIDKAKRQKLMEGVKTYIYFVLSILLPFKVMCCSLCLHFNFFLIHINCGIFVLHIYRYM